MVHMERKAGLLDMLAEQTGCEYLSVLRSPKVFPLLSNVLHGVDQEEYSLSEWQDAILYITGKVSASKNAAQAKEYLCAQLLKEAGGTK